MHRDFLEKKQKLWKRSYQVLTVTMAFSTLFLLAIQNSMTAVLKQDTIKVIEPRLTGNPNVEVVGKIKELNAIPSIELSKQEYSILTRIVEAETTGGDLKSKRIVTGVILNRVKSEKFPDTIEEVVFQRNKTCAQFSPISDGRYYRVTVTEETKKAVRQVLEGQDDAKGALFFANRKYSSVQNMKWFDNHLKYLFSYGGHEYFTIP